MDDSLDAHAKPPAELRTVYKTFHKTAASSLHTHPNLVQFEETASTADCSIQLKRCLDLPAEIREAFGRFLPPLNTTPCNPTDGGTRLSNDADKSNGDGQKLPYLRSQHYVLHEHGEDLDGIQDRQRSPPVVYEVPDVPGLYIYPSLFPPEVQLELLEKLLHRDLCNAQHQTNVHMHYRVPYPNQPDTETAGSFFDDSARGTVFQPLDSGIHKPISNEQFLNKKLRWTTLGGQYDWTKKVYPSGPPPAFPADIKQLIEDIFPMKAEAAIVNLYSPGDTLSLHRDVSEECNRPLASVSLGCDALFIAGVAGENANGKPRVATIRLRSGDAVLMSGESRYAWHGVPKVLEGTCPVWMEDWPCRDTENGSDRFQHWKGWMKGKRVNLNVRQMFG